jgi:RNA polymerase sigma-70 factor (ECF subfamily)
MTSQIADRSGAGGPETLEELLRSALGPAYNFAIRLTRDEADAEDLVQDAALRACRFFDQFQPGTNFRAWFFKILANCYHNRWRQEGRRGTRVSIEDAPPLHLYLRSSELGLIDEGADPAGALLERLGTDEIAEALSQLPEDYRTVATLYFVEDFKYAEIAEVLGIPIGTVRSRLHRGRRLLQTSLWDLATEHGLVAPKEAS